MSFLKILSIAIAITHTVLPGQVCAAEEDAVFDERALDVPPQTKAPAPPAAPVPQPSPAAAALPPPVAAPALPPAPVPTATNAALPTPSATAVVKAAPVPTQVPVPTPAPVPAPPATAQSTPATPPSPQPAAALKAAATSVQVAPIPVPTTESAPAPAAPSATGSISMRTTPPVSSPAARAAATSRLSELNLSPEQTAAIVEMRRQWKNDEEQKIKSDLALAKQELYQAMSDGTPADVVKKKFEAVQKNYVLLQGIKFEKSLKIREILSTEQRKKFQELRIRSANNSNEPAP